VGVIAHRLFSYLKNLMGVINNLSDLSTLKLGFTYAELEHLGMAFTLAFEETYAVDISDISISKLIRLYKDVIADCQKYKVIVEWLIPRLEQFILLNVPMRIYIGGKKRFLVRGDEALETSLGNILNVCRSYSTGCSIKPSQISAIIYYLNLLA